MAGCTTYVPALPTPPASCVVLMTTPYSDSLTVGIYRPPCDQLGDTVMFWQIETPARCRTLGVLDPVKGTAKVTPHCPEKGPVVEVAL